LVPFLLFSLSSCGLFGPSSAPVATRKPASKTPAKSTDKVVDTKTYQKGYVGQMVRVARTYTVTPYRSGGNTKSGIDCSGLIASVFNTVGLKMPRISWQQSEVGYEVEVKAIRPGDLLFFVPDKGKSGFVSHAAIVTEVNNYDSDIRFIHASSSRGVPTIRVIAESLTHPSTDAAKSSDSTVTAVVTLVTADVKLGWNVHVTGTDGLKVSVMNDSS